MEGVIGHVAATSGCSSTVAIFYQSGAHCVYFFRPTLSVLLRYSYSPLFSIDGEDMSIQKLAGYYDNVADGIPF
jgi:hypothetical protein